MNSDTHIRQFAKDPVTGVKNSFAVRFAMEQYLEEKKEESCAVLVLKIEGMERIFSAFGTVFGSAVLQNIGEIVRHTFGSTNIIGRAAAGEFLIFMQHADEGIANCKAGEISSRVSELYAGELSGQGILANVGIAYYPQDGRTCELLYRHAKTAAEYAKKRGNKSILSYNSQMIQSEEQWEELVFSQEKEIKGIYDMDFLSFAFALLSHSRDLNSAINLLLGRIGSRYDLSSVSIFEKDRENSRLMSTNLWSRENGIWKEQETVICIERNRTADQQEYLCIEDCDHTEFDVSSYQKICQKHIKSLMVYYFEDEIMGEGSIFFVDCRRKRCWSEVERSTLCECGRMISVFVFLRKERSQDKKKITELMSKDQLTGLLNRETFEQEVAVAAAMDHSFGQAALVFTDINDFEYVNSNFGMEAGNQILWDYARNLERREGMQAGCRIYSDYFLSLCYGRSKIEIIENINRSDDAFVECQRKRYPASSLRLSTGVCFLNSSHEIEEPAVLVENANLARRRAKDYKNNHVEVYREDYRLEKEHEQKVAGSIHEAIRRREMELFLQPKFSLTTRCMIGAEALARWHQKDGTYKIPAEFIPVLEKVGYIVELDFFMYEEVLKHIGKWRRDGKRLVPVSVNFSRRHIQNEDFVKRISALAQKYDIEPGLIEIEITESTISDNNQKMLKDLSQLQEQGFKVDIDDFGTGYSSLNMLLNAPVDTVKVDKSFLRNIDTSEKERRYIDRLAHLIDAAEKEIVFEGVETEHQARILTECGYTMAQGYLFGKPMPVEEFDRTYMMQEETDAVSGT